MKATASPPYFPYPHRTLAEAKFWPRTPGEMKVMKGWWPGTVKPLRRVA